jgi:protoporphyrinogen oxidase
MNQTAIIIGAGPAGLTAALELVRRSKITPVVLEKSDRLGGLACTVNYKGNRIDIGGHRFFSKSDRVMDWWLEVLPLQKISGNQLITYQNRSRGLSANGGGPDPAATDAVILLRRRKSRIYFRRRFFDYPVRLSPDTLRKLGLARTSRIAASYLRAAARPIRPERNLEDFFINRFGRELYRTFFESYTEKVWGLPCSQISAEWGAQRVKGLSIYKTIAHFGRQLLPGRRRGEIRQKGTETSLIEQFLYPKLGPGQMWEEVTARVRRGGGQVATNLDVRRVRTRGNRVVAVEALDRHTGKPSTFEGDYFFSTMPVRELLAALDCHVPADIRAIGDGLVYRDFITVGLLAKELAVKDRGGPIEDNWIYIQEPDVLVGRLQIFNNWSPYMVADPQKVWVGLEYFCNESDALWSRDDAALIALAKEEMERIGILKSSKVLDGCVLRIPKAYPAYFGTYQRFEELRQWLLRFENLFLVGRNGMHKYNNQDHSMLAAMTAVDNILAGRTDQSNIWAVNTEQEYHESK